MIYCVLFVVAALEVPKDLLLWLEISLSLECVLLCEVKGFIPKCVLLCVIKLPD